VAFPLSVRGLARAEQSRRVSAALDLVQLREFSDRYPRQLSGGQQQRVALARALVFEPAVLLLDEPLSALDRKLRTSLQWELRDLHRRLGKTFICVTHDQDEALSLSDEIAIIREGRVVQKGTPSELYDRPTSYFVAEFLGESNFLEGLVTAADANGFEYEVAGRRFRHGGAGTIEQPGRSVLIALRPNKLQIATTEPTDRPNRIDGKVRQLSYRGRELSLKVDTAVGTLTVEQPTWPLTTAPTLGQLIWLCWSPDATVTATDDRKDRAR
jgi:putative spermidine/putrescine transport system ATP-binding protein